jgi:hypothetical protein
MEQHLTRCVSGSYVRALLCTLESDVIRSTLIKASRRLDCSPAAHRIARRTLSLERMSATFLSLHEELGFDAYASMQASPLAA